MSALEVAQEALRDLKAAHARESAQFDKWHALARAIIADGNQDSIAWLTLAAQLEAS